MIEHNVSIISFCGYAAVCTCGARTEDNLPLEAVEFWVREHQEEGSNEEAEKSVR